MNGCRIKAPQLGAALAYYTVFSLAPLILVLLAIVGVIFRDDPAGAWERITQQMSYFLDPSAVQSCRTLRKKLATWQKHDATIIGITLALFGASGVFGQLQDALNTIWGVKAKPVAVSGDSYEIASFVYDGCRRLFPAARLVNPRKPS